MNTLKLLLIGHCLDNILRNESDLGFFFTFFESIEHRYTDFNLILLISSTIITVTLHSPFTFCPEALGQ